MTKGTAVLGRAFFSKLYLGRELQDAGKGRKEEDVTRAAFSPLPISPVLDGRIDVAGRSGPVLPFYAA